MNLATKSLIVCGIAALSAFACSSSADAFWGRHHRHHPCQPVVVSHGCCGGAAYADGDGGSYDGNYGGVVETSYSGGGMIYDGGYGGGGYYGGSPGGYYGSPGVGVGIGAGRGGFYGPGYGPGRGPGFYGPGYGGYGGGYGGRGGPGRGPGVNIRF